MWRAILGVLAALVLVAAAALYWLLSGDGIRLALERQAGAWLEQPVAIGAAEASFYSRIGVRLRDVRVGDANAAPLTLERVDVSAPIGALLRRRLEDADILVSGGHVVMPLPFGLPRPAVENTTAAGAAAAGAGAGMTLVSIRSITLRDITLLSRGRSVTLSADSSLAGDTLAIDDFRASSDATTLRATGSVALSPRVNATLTAASDNLDVDALLALAAAFGSDGSAVAGGPGAHIEAAITAPRARISGVPLGRFDASLVADAGEVRIEPLRFDVFGGRFDGWVDASFGEQMDIRLGVGVSNVDIEQLAAFGGAPGAISGRLYGSGRFGARGADAGSALAAARGVGEIKAGAGAMANLAIVSTVVGFLGGNDAPRAAGGERFESIEATFALADRVLRSDDLVLRSADYEVLARGTLSAASKALDARASLVLSEQLSQRAGRDLYRYTRSGNRIVLPATIGGTLGEPRVRIDAAAALRRGIQNEVERRLQDAFERFGR